LDTFGYNCGYICETNIHSDAANSWPGHWNARPSGPTAPDANGAVEQLAWVDMGQRTGMA